MNDLENVRIIIKKDKNIQKYLKDNSFKNLRYSNFGFIAVLPEFVLKHYIGKDFFVAHWINFDPWDFFLRERDNYRTIKEKSDILIPEFDYYKTIKIPYKLEIAKIENIRTNTKVESFLDLGMEGILSLIQKFHKIKEEWDKYFIHGNIHPTNFYLKDSRIWMFDFMYCKLDYKEIDLARIIIYTDYNFDFLRKLKDLYKNSLNKKILAYYVKKHTVENYKYSKDIDSIRKMKNILDLVL